MNDWFSWNGKKCTEYGIHVLEQPPVTISAERATFTNVPGRPGSLTTLEGDDVYDDLILTAQCMISDPSNIRTIASYLKGSGKVAFANRPGGFYFARIVNQIPFEKILRGNPHRSFAVNFRCQPFWYQENVPETTVTTSGTFVTNPGSVYSEPVITVYGSGEITLMVGMTIVELDGITDSITLDTPLMVYATNHPDGCVLMADNISRRTEYLVIDIQQRGQLSLFPPTAENSFISPETIDNQMRTLIQRKYKSQAVSLSKLQADFFDTYGVVCSSKELSSGKKGSSLKRLEKNGEIEVERMPSERNGTPTRFWSEQKDQKVTIKGK